MNNLFSVLSKSDKYGNLFGKTIVSNVDIPSETLVYKITNYVLTNSPTYQTIQISKDLHLQDDGAISFMNHSCNPNCIIDTAKLGVYANKDINKGDELTFFYPSTELRLSQPFNCNCGYEKCIKYIDGLHSLDITEISKIYFINRKD